jgi:hypothetical protein
VPRSKPLHPAHPASGSARADESSFAMNRANRATRTRAASWRPILSLKNLFTLTGMLGIAALAGIFLSGGTFAFLNSSVSLNSATIKSGSAELTVSGAPLALSGLYPGGSVSAPFTVTNTSDTGTDPASTPAFALALNVTAFSKPASDAALLSSSVKVRLDAAVSGVCPATLPVTPLWSANLTDPSPTNPVSLGVSVAKGASTTLCLSALLPSGASTSLEGKATNNFTITIGGVQS